MRKLRPTNHKHTKDKEKAILFGDMPPAVVDTKRSHRQSNIGKRSVLRVLWQTVFVLRKARKKVLLSCLLYQTALLPGGNGMTQEQFQGEARYHAAMSVVHTMLSNELITKNHATKLEEMFREKYRPIIAPFLYSDIPINITREVCE